MNSAIGNVLSKEEYVCSMLETLGVISPNEYVGYIVKNEAVVRFLATISQPGLNEILVNHSVKRFASREAAFTARNILFISVVSRGLLGVRFENQIIKAELVVDEILDQAIKKICKALQEYKIGIADDAESNSPVINTDVAPFSFFSPLWNKFVTLLIVLDKLYTINTTLLETGKIERKKLFKLQKENKHIAIDAVLKIGEVFRFIVGVMHAKK